MQLFQVTPLLMQLFLAYFGLALLGLPTTAWVAATLALALYASAFLTPVAEEGGVFGDDGHGEVSW